MMNINNATIEDHIKGLREKGGKDMIKIKFVHTLLRLLL